MQQNKSTIRSDGKKLEITPLREQLLELLRPVAKEVAHRLMYGNQADNELEQNLRHRTKAK
jgi:hypothetical protein